MVPLSSVHNQSFLNALRLNSCLIRFDLSNMERTSRSNSLPVSRTLWKVAFLWSACRAYKILLCESIRACKVQKVPPKINCLNPIQVCFIVKIQKKKKNHLQKLFGHRQIKKMKVCNTEMSIFSIINSTQSSYGLDKAN